MDLQHFQGEKPNEGVIVERFYVVVIEDSGKRKKWIENEMRAFISHRRRPRDGNKRYFKQSFETPSRKTGRTKVLPFKIGID